jgi:hypothetical protein
MLNNQPRVARYKVRTPDLALNSIAVKILEIIGFFIGKSPERKRILGSFTAF